MDWYGVYFKKLRECDIPEESVDKLEKDYGSLIKTSSFATREDSGLAYEGSLMEVTLTKLTSYAVQINGILPKEKQCDPVSLKKVCLLQHISKCVRLIKQTDEWRQKKLGESFTYKDNNPAIRTGMHSYMICTQCGITFNEEETEAMTIMDKDSDDAQVQFHSSLLATIVKIANELTYSSSKIKQVAE